MDVCIQFDGFLATTSLHPCLRILLCLLACQVSPSAQLDVSASLLCSVQPVADQIVEPEQAHQAHRCELYNTLACCLSARAETHRREEYNSRPAEKARRTTGNRDGSRASSPTGPALAVVV